VVHANGQGAFGHFVVTNDVTRWTKAKLFNRIGKVTPVFVRFSSTAGMSSNFSFILISLVAMFMFVKKKLFLLGGSSSSQTLHDPRGFALRFYTEDGNLDFPGLPVDVFSVRDPMIFVDAKRGGRKNPETGLVDRNQGFDFFSLRPEIIHSFLKTTSDSGQPGMRKKKYKTIVEKFIKKIVLNVYQVPCEV
jgi:catalase